MSKLKISGGVTQSDRMPRGLQAGHFRLDDRTIQDLLVEAHEYARLLRYYGADNRPDGDWTCFWKSDPTILLATVAALNTDEIRRKYEAIDLEFGQMLDRFNDPDDDRCADDPSDDFYRQLLRYLRDMAQQLEQFYRDLSAAGLPLAQELLRMIRYDNACDQEELNGALQRLIGLHKTGDDYLTYETYRFAFQDNASAAADNHWGISDRVMFEQIAAVAPVDRVQLRDLFIIFYKNLVLLKTRAQRDFDLNFQADKQVHPPHIALFLTFLRLFRYAQSSLNDLVDRHLDFYYEQVLGLRRRPASPDEAYLIFELAKGIDAYLLKKGTTLLGGKDKNGQPLLYETVEDWVVRGAKVADLKNTYLDAISGKILANPDVHKKYVDGAALPNEKANRWRAMGDDADLPVGELGFAIASPQLILREGRRMVTITLDIQPPIATPQRSNSTVPLNELKSEYFQAYLSSEKDWLLLEQNAGISNLNAPIEHGSFYLSFNNPTPNQILIFIVLERDDLPIDTLGEELAKKSNFQSSWPLLKVVLNPDLKQQQLISPVAVYEALRTLKISEITIKVDVVGIRENLIIQSDQGIFDGTQKVYPFGPTPEVGNHFYVGSTEAFQKALSNLNVEFDWLDAPADFNAYYDEYAKVGIRVPKPAVQVDFIDRAQTPPARQVVRSGVRGPDDLISGRVTNVDNEGVGNVNIDLLATDGTIVRSLPSDTGTGKYSILATGGTMLRFTPPSTGIDQTLETLSEYTEPSGSTSVKINVETFSTINAILYPKQVRFQQYDAAKGISGRVVDVYGVGVDKVRITGGDTPFNTDKTGNFNLPFSSGALPTEITLTPPSEYGLPKEIQLQQFSEIEIILFPEEKLTPGDDDLDVEKIVSGIITGTDKAPLEHASVQVQIDQQSITVFSTNNGAYAIPVESDDSDLKFFSGPYEHLIVGRAFLEKKDKLKKNIDATLFVPPQVEEVFFNGEITITIQDYEGHGIDGVIIEKIGGSPEVIEPASTQPDGVYVLSDLPLNLPLVLRFSKNGDEYEPVIVDVREYSGLDIKMFPKDGLKRINDRKTGAGVTVNVYTYDGKDITKEASYFKGTATTSTSLGTSNAISSVSNNTKLKISAPNFITLEEVSVKDSSILNVFLKPKTTDFIDDTNDHALAGSIVDAEGSKINEPFNVLLAGTLNDSIIQYRINTSNGDFKFTLLKNLKKRKIIFTDQAGYVTEIEVDTKNTDRFFSKQIKKSRTVLGPLHVEITEVDDEAPVPINNVKITYNGGSFTAGTDGTYILSSYPNENDHITFSHPLYEPLTITVEPGVLLLKVRLKPLPAYGLVSGTVKDIYGNIIPGATIALTDTVVGHSGTVNYRTKVPIDASPALGFDFDTYSSLPIPWPTSPGAPTTADRSRMDVVLYFKNLNLVSLLENSGAGTINKTVSVRLNALSLRRDVRTQHFDQYSPTLKRGFVRLTLAEDDFRHKDYQKVLVLYTINAAQAGALNLTNGILPPMPKPPYTPATNGIRLNYTSTQSILKENEDIDQYFHLLSFNGHKRNKIDQDTPIVQLVYPYPADDEANTDFARGNLFIGLSDLQPGGGLSLLVQIADGTEADPDLLPPVIHWSYMAENNTWRPFGAGKILRDDTRGFTRGGMIQLAVPTTIVQENTLLDPRYYWLRVAAVEVAGVSSASALPAIMDIRAQVVQVRFKNEDNELSHLAAPLPAGNISKLVLSRSEVKKVEQPQASFHGRLPEDHGQGFYTRISERLRHKDRAVTGWDYEHLLLEHYPEIATVKCLPHTRYQPADVASECAPGYVTVAVIPQLRKRANEPWPEPRFSRGDLNEMRDYLATRTNLFVATEDHLQVINPLYEKVNIEAGINFRKELGDEAFFTEQLRQELEQYLSPWLADFTTMPAFGRNLQYSAILQFIEERPYVDTVQISQFYISMLELSVSGQPVMDTTGKAKVRIISPTEDIVPSTVRSILVAGQLKVSPAKTAVLLTGFPTTIAPSPGTASAGNAEVLERWSPGSPSLAALRPEAPPPKPKLKSKPK